MIDWKTLYRVDVTPSEWTELSPCWIWLGVVTETGYAHLPHREHGTLLAHRALFAEHGGLLVDGEELDHRCRMRLCVRPDHLESVDQRTNKQRGNSRAGVGRGAPINHRAASLAAQAGDWGQYRELARVDEGALPMKPKRFTLSPSFARRWAEALRTDPVLVDESGTVDEGLAWPRSATDVLASALPHEIGERLKPDFSPVILVQAVTGPLRAKVERVAGGEDFVSVESLAEVLYPAELADVIGMVFVNAEVPSC